MNVPIAHKPVILAIFVITYLGLAMGKIPGLRLNRTGIALLGAIGVMIFSGSTTSQTASSVNWPTIFLLFGFFVISAQLRLSGFYDQVAVSICNRLSEPKRFLVFLIVVAATLSAFLNNDVVCYVLTPVVTVALLRKQMNPVPFLVALAAASNIGAAGTLIGNAQNMMIGSVARLGFLRYMLWSLVPVTFGLAGVYLATRTVGRPGPPALLNEEIEPLGPEYPFDRYHTAKGLLILAAVIAFFFTTIPREITVLVAAGIHLLSTKFKTEHLLSLVDWSLLLLFTALFVVSGAFQETGYAEHLVTWMQRIGVNPAKPVNEALLTAGLSVLINNAPAVMLLIKIVPLVQASNAYIMAVANSFAGNAIMTASVANIIVVQQARRQGIVVTFWDFGRIGLPITLFSLGGLLAWSAFLAR